MSVRASPLDQHGLEWDEQDIITTRLFFVISPGCYSDAALPIFFSVPWCMLPVFHTSCMHSALQFLVPHGFCLAIRFAVLLDLRACVPWAQKTIIPCQ